MENVKTTSSRWIKSRFSRKEFAWQSGYGATSIAAYSSEDCVKYIREQEEHHQHQTFEEEYREIMKLAGVEIDERYVWD